MQVVGVVFGILVVVMVAWAQVVPNVTEPPCDSPVAEAAALLFQDYINAERSSGFKYALNQIDEIKITSVPGTEIYKMEIDLLETKCHVLDPTPLARCQVRTKQEVAVEADCDVILTKSGGFLTVTKHRCKSEPETSVEDLCLGCPQLLPLNETNALELVTASLASYNNRTTNVTTSKYTVLEVGRLATQVLSGAAHLFAEYAIVETNCTTTDENCVPLNKTSATYGFCRAGGMNASISVECQIFAKQNLTQPTLDLAANGTKPLQQMIDIGIGQLSAESAETVEALGPAKVLPIVKRQIPSAETMAPALQPVTLPLPTCPGKVKFF